MRFMLRNVLLGVLVLGVGLMLSCQKEDDDNPSGPSNQGSEYGEGIDPDTYVMDPDEAELVTASGDSMVYEFTGTPPNIEVGRVLIDGEDGGYLKKVVGVTRDGNRLIIQTAQATFTDAFEELAIDTTFQPQYTSSAQKPGLQNNRYWTATYLRDGVSISDAGVTLSEVVLLDDEDAVIQIASGEVSYTPGIDFDIDLSWGDIERLDLIATGDLEFDCEMAAELMSAGLDRESEIEIASFSHTFATMVGLVPVVAEVELDFYAGYELSASVESEISSGLSLTSSTEVGASYNNGSWSPVWERNTETNAYPPTWTADGGVELRGYVKPELHVNFYHVAGPYLYVDPGVGFAGEIHANPPSWSWELYARLGAYVGFQVEIFDQELVELEQELATWELSIANDSGVSYDIPTPSNPSPTNGATGVATTTDLSWNCTPPQGVSLTYDVYFGTVQDPPQVESGQTATSYDPGDLDMTTTYYWKVVASDGEGDSQTSPTWSFTTTGPGNQPPAAPSNPSPSDNAEGVATTTDLSWSCSDPDSDPLTYDVYFGTSSNPSRVSTGQSASTYDPGTLDYEETYYWKVVAKDDHSHETSSPVWSFTIAGEGNQPPTAPTSPNPADNADGVATTTDLSWSCSDPDQDPLTYDVYFGTSSNPSRVSTGQSASTYDPGTLDYEETYCWKVVAKDDHNHETSSSVWSFTVAGEGNQPPTAPYSPNPSDNATGVATTTDLSWSCSDPDQDPLTYDVYFGTSMSPPLVSSGQYQESYDAGELDTETDYYWQIVAKDVHNNETSGPVWSFTTEDGGGGDIIEQDFELGDTGEMITMVWIPAGTFMMGAQEGEDDAYDSEYPRHEVTITEGFWMGKYEVTQAQWEAVAGYENFNWPGNPDRPAERVSWNDINDDFLPELGDEWRLPTEAEWEYACRAGYDETRFWWGDDPGYTELGDYAWYSSNSNSQTHDVGQKLPNPWGLYDMHGNVWEWCSDWYDSDFYETSPGVDPQGPATGSYRVFRGGSWSSLARYCRSAFRGSTTPATRNRAFGFRLLRSGD